MRIGIIGSGKVGTSLGKFFVSKGLSLTGFFDSYEKEAIDAADFTGTKYYEKLEDLVKDSDTLFLTVPDGLITEVWNAIKDMPVKGKYICHCSGALSAGEAFPKAEERGAYIASVHPLFAVSDKYHSYQELDDACFTIEGGEKSEDMVKLFKSFGNPVVKIMAENKVKYHLAAAIASNHVIALMEQSLSLLTECGFDEEGARKALTPIVTKNVSHILQDGTAASLTGPVERGDVTTVKKHLACLSEEDQLLYRLLSKKLLNIGKKKNPTRDYSALEVEVER